MCILPLKALSQKNSACRGLAAFSHGKPAKVRVYFLKAIPEWRCESESYSEEYKRKDIKKNNIKTISVYHRQVRWIARRTPWKEQS